jgi:hypothetical protein
LHSRRLVGLIALGTVSLTLAGAALHAEPRRTAETCRAAVDTAVQDYMAARRLALLQCHSDTNEGRLHPCDCETEPATAGALATAERAAFEALYHGCNDATVTSAPPTGIGAEFCGEDDACGFSVTRFDDGRRNDRNDYVDCLFCLANDAVNTQIESAYAGVTTAAPPRPVRECRIRFTQALIALDTRRHALESHCPTCPKTTARVTEAQHKIASRLLASCRTTGETAVSQSSSPVPSSPTDPRAPSRTAQKR